MEALGLDEVRTVVLLWLGRLGDVLITTPVIASIRRRFPGARITFVTGEHGKGAAGLLKDIDETLLLRRFHHPLENLLLASRLMRSETDLLIDLNSAPSRAAAALLRLARAKITLGFAKDWGDSAMTHRLEAPSVTEHMLDRYARMAASLGADYDPRTRVNVSPEDKKLADAALSGLSGKGGLVAVHPGNFKKYDNRWPSRNFVGLLDRLEGREDIRPFLLAGPGEKERVQAIAARLRRPVPVLGPLPLGVTAALLSRLRLFAGNATGTAHLAAAVGTPTFLLLGRYTNTIWMPTGKALCLGRSAPRPSGLDEVRTGTEGGSAVDSVPAVEPEDAALLPGGIVRLEADMNGARHFSVVSSSWGSCRDIPVDDAFEAFSAALEP